MATRRVGEAVAPEGGLARAVDFDMEAAWGRRAGGTMTMFPRFLPSPARPIRWQSVSVGASRAVRVGLRGAIEGLSGARHLPPEVALEGDPQGGDEARDGREDHHGEEARVTDVVLQPATPHPG